jgi:hypothetical protein
MTPETQRALVEALRKSGNWAALVAGRPDVPSLIRAAAENIAAVNRGLVARAEKEGGA